MGSGKANTRIWHRRKEKIMNDELDQLEVVEKKFFVKMFLIDYNSDHIKHPPTWCIAMGPFMYSLATGGMIGGNKLDVKKEERDIVIADVKWTFRNDLKTLDIMLNLVNKAAVADETSLFAEYVEIKVDFLRNADLVVGDKCKVFGEDMVNLFVRTPKNLSKNYKFPKTDVPKFLIKAEDSDFNVYLIKTKNGDELWADKEGLALQKKIYYAPFDKEFSWIAETECEVLSVSKISKETYHALCLNKSKDVPDNNESLTMKTLEEGIRKLILEI